MNAKMSCAASLLIALFSTSVLAQINDNNIPLKIKYKHDQRFIKVKTKRNADTPTGSVNERDGFLVYRNTCASGICNLGLNFRIPKNNNDLKSKFSKLAFHFYDSAAKENYLNIIKNGGVTSANCPVESVTKSKVVINIQNANCRKIKMKLKSTAITSGEANIFYIIEGLPKVPPMSLKCTRDRLKPDGFTSAFPIPKTCITADPVIIVRG